MVERAEFANVAGEFLKRGTSSFATSTGWTVTPRASGEYVIERLRLVVHAI